MLTKRETKIRRSWQRLWTALDKNLLPFAKDGLLLLISGGPDSRALLEAIASWPNRSKGKYFVVTFDHGQRKESCKESTLVASRAKMLGFDVQRISLYGDSLSECELRDKRHRFSMNICKQLNFKYFCMAHHSGDVIENNLMAIFGLGGGAKKRDMLPLKHFDEFTIIRPFLHLTKEELILPLSLSHIDDYFIDGHNERRVGLRAKIRQDVLPLMLSIDKNVSNAIIKSSLS